MRKNIQKQLLDLLDTIIEGINFSLEISKNPEISENTIKECYEAIISIEACFSDGFSKDCFDKYKKLIDTILDSFQNLNDEIWNGGNINKVYKYTKKLLFNIKNQLENEKEVKLEVVFLPYKASMWDSLESVYLAAKNDLRCNVICMPIPYFDRNLDSIGEMHYEGDLFPDYIQITDWQSYNLKEQKPDMIFIHNPYDQYNYVTSIHPAFYSSELKKYTNMLVYIPYFVLAQIDPSSPQASDKVSKFSNNMGVLNADKVIVQSESMREIYINELIKFTNNNDRLYWQNKIIALGSPKFDKVINSKKEDYELPKEWVNIIGNKEIILFNTSITTALYHNEKYLIKLRYVLDFFKNRDDVVLWWRPHPLLEQTFRSMRPNLLEEYQKIVEEYCNAKYGIYDNTSDLNRAIAWCDRYYGDRSSVMFLYGATGKPVMISAMNWYIRKVFEINYWFTFDLEDGDLKNWIESKNKFKLLKKFFDMYDYEYRNGNSGESIYLYCKKKCDDL